MKKFVRNSALSLFLLIIVFSPVACKGDKEKAIPQGNVQDEGLKSWYNQVADENVDLAPRSDLKNYYIIFDGSGSMSGQKIADAKIALKKFISIIPANANIGLLAFDRNGVSERVKLGSKKDDVIGEIDKFSAGGRTPLGESAIVAFHKLAVQAKRQLGYGEYNLVIITDGEATDLGTLEKAVDVILALSPITIYTIGFQIDSGHTLNQPGRIYYKTAKNVDELSRSLKDVLAELPDFSVKKF